MPIRRGTGGTGLVVVGIAAILLLAFIFVVHALMNVDRYRPRVISYLQEKTGKQVEIGRLALTFFPLTIHIDRIGVKNPPRIDAELSVGAPKRRRKDDRENGRGRSVSGRKSHIRYARWQESAEADT
ncbi:MAG: hypothetical protein DMG76_24715 [Acidobacteria bacterium]|nr:MAG: hypothetical protein DMG76_24715 [Acidobacteriota bacterium]